MYCVTCIVTYSLKSSFTNSWTDRVLSDNLSTKNRRGRGLGRKGDAGQVNTIITEKSKNAFPERTRNSIHRRNDKSGSGVFKTSSANKRKRYRTRKT